MASAMLQLTVDTKLAVWGIRAASFLHPVIGPRLAVRLAQWSVNRLIRYRVGGLRWRHLDPGVRIAYSTGHELRRGTSAHDKEEPE